MPELDDFSVWSLSDAAKDITDPNEQIKQYGLYLKKGYLADEEMSDFEKIENINEVNEIVVNRLAENGLSDEDINILFESKVPSVEEQISKYKRSGVTLAPEDAEKVHAYDAFLQVAQNPETPQSYIDENAESLRTAAANTLYPYNRQFADNFLQEGIAPFARMTVEGEKGPEEILVGGSAAEGLSMSEAYQRSLEVGAIEEEDIDQLVALMQKNADGIPLYKLNNYSEAKDGLVFASDVDNLFGRYTQRLAQIYQETGSFDDATLKEAISGLRRDHGDVFEGLPDNDIAAGIKALVGTSVYSSGLIEYDEETPANNIKKFGYGDVSFHPNLLESDSLFEEAIAESSPTEQRVLRAQRDASSYMYYEAMDAAFADTYLKEEWSLFKLKAKEEGREGIEVLNEFKESQDYKEFTNIFDEAKGSFTGSYMMTANVGGVLLNDEDSIKTLADHQKKAMSRAKVARFFGEDFGMGTDLLSIGSALVADGTQVLAATKGASILGTPFLVAGKATMRGLVKTVIGNEIRKSLLKTAATRGITKSISKSIAADQAISQVVKSSAATLANSNLVRYPVMLAQSGIQSGTSTYISIYDYLKNSDEDLTEEQIRDRALYGGMAAGVVTASLIGAFGSIGRGGLEDAILQKATGREVKKVLEKMSKVKMSEGIYRDTLKDIIKEGSKKFYGGFFGSTSSILKSGFDEALEEGADSFFNTIVEAVATNQDVSVLEVLKSAGMGALYGGIMGTAGPTARSIYSRTMDFMTGGPKTFRRDLIERQVAQKVGERVAQNLTKTNSSQAAAEFTRQYNEALTGQIRDEARQFLGRKEEPQAEAEAPQAEAPQAEAPQAEEATETKISFTQTLQLGNGTVRFRKLMTSPDPSTAAVSLEIDPDTDNAELSRVVGNLSTGRFMDATVTVKDTKDGKVITRKTTEGEVEEYHLVRASNGSLVPKNSKTAKLFFDLEYKSQKVREFRNSKLNPSKTQLDVDQEAPEPKPSEKISQQTEEESREAANEARKEIQYEKLLELIKSDPDLAQAYIDAITDGSMEDGDSVYHEILRAVQFKEQLEYVSDDPVLKEKLDELLNKNNMSVPDALDQLLPNFELGIETSEFAESDQTDLDDAEQGFEDAAKKKEERINSVIEALASFGFLVLPKSKQYNLGSVGNVQINKVKKAIALAIEKNQKDPNSQNYVPSNKELIDLYDLSSEADIEVKTSLNNAPFSKMDGFLFNNDPLAAKSVIDAGHQLKVPDDYDGPINTDVFVIEDGVVVDVLKPSEVDMKPVSALKDTTESTIHDTKASANSNFLNGSLGAKSSPSLSLTFKQAGFYTKSILQKLLNISKTQKSGEGQLDFNLRSKEQKKILDAMVRDGAFNNAFVLDGELTLSEAIQRLRAWFGENYASITSVGIDNYGTRKAGVNSHASNIFKLASNIERLGLRSDADVKDLQLTAFAQLLIEIELDIKVEYLRKRLSEISDDIDVALEEYINTDEFVEFFDMRNVNEFLENEENHYIYLARSKSDASNLNRLNATPLQQIAAFLYHTTSGQGGLLNKKTFTDEVLDAARQKDNKGNWELKEGWETVLTKTIIKGLVNLPKFQKKKGAYPNFFEHSKTVGTRVRNKARSLKNIDRNKSQMEAASETYSETGVDEDVETGIETETEIETEATTVEDTTFSEFAPASDAPLSFQAFFSRIPNKFPAFIRQMTENMPNRDVVRLASYRLLSNRVDFDGQFDIYQDDIISPEDFDSLTDREKEFLVYSGYNVPTVESSVTFATSQGSTYKVEEGGSTVRNKKYRPEHGEEDQGIQPSSEKTVYLSKEDIGRLAQGSATSFRVIDNNNGTLTYAYKSSKGEWKVAPTGQKIPYKTEPEVGLYPVELWEEEAGKAKDNRVPYKSLHVGNDITSVEIVGGSPINKTQEEISSSRRVYDKLFNRRNNAPNLGTEQNLENNRLLNTRKILELGLEDGDVDSVLNALERIRQSGVDESHQLVAELLLRDPDFIKQFDIRIIDDPNESAGFFGYDANGRGVVTINIAATYGKGVESVLLHEYLHAFTDKLLSTDSSLLTIEQRRAKAKLENLRKLIIEEHDKKQKTFNNKSQRVAFEEGVSTLNEFISSLFTSPTLQQEVRSLPQRGLLRKVINAIKSLFGIDPKSNLDRAFDDLVDFLNMDTVPDLAGRDLVTRRMLQEISINRAEKADKRAKDKLGEESRRQFEGRGYDSLDNLSSDDVLSETQLNEINQLIREVAIHTIPSSAAPVIILDENESIVEFAGMEGELFKEVQVPDGNGGSALVILVNGKNSSEILARYGDIAVNSKHLKMIVEAELNSVFVRAVQAVELSDKDIDAVINDLSDKHFIRFIDSYVDPESKEAALAALRSDDPTEVKRRLVRDMFVAQYTRASRGYTSFEDAAFYATNPSTAKVFMRFLSGTLKKMSLQAKLRTNNPKIHRMISEISDEISYIKSGGRFDYSVKQFDVQVPDESIIAAARAINSSIDEITDETTYEEIVEMIPMFKAYKIALGAFGKGGYKSRTGISAMLNSQLDPRVLELKKQSDAVLRAVDQSTEVVARDILNYLDKRSVSEALLGDYLGRPDDIEVSEDQENFIKDAFKIKLKDLEDRGVTITKEVESALYKKEVSDKIASERKRLIEVARSKRDIAAQNLEQNHPELYDNLKRLRLILDSMSKLMKDEFDVNGELGAVIDSRLGIYVTRTYRAFTDRAYMDTIKGIMKGDFTNVDQVMVENYESALEIFKEEYIDLKVNALRSDDPLITPEDARQQVEDNFVSDPNAAAIVKGAMRDYIESLDVDSRYMTKSGGQISIAKSIIDNIKKRKRVPVALRKFLGQHGDGEVVNNVIRSAAKINRALARESFISNMIALGTVPENRFVYNTDDLSQMSPAEIYELDLVNMRTGAPYEYGQKPEGLSEEDAEFNKGFHHYIDRKAHEDLQRFLESQVVKDSSDDAFLSDLMGAGVQLAQGVTLTAKTLFGFGFFERNVLGNLAFFGPMQGLNPLTLSKHIGEVMRVINPMNSNQSLRSLDAYRARLLSLNVTQSDITSQLLGDLLNENVKLDRVKQELYDVAEKLKLAKAADLAGEAKEKLVDPLMNRLMMLSQAVDDFYKIGYYEIELSTLKRARDSDRKRGVDTGYRNLTDEDLETMAAKKVRDTSQSYTDTYEGVKKLSSRFGFVLASFLRFKADVIRIAVQTPPLFVKEMWSGNPVVFFRGLRRAFGYSLIMGGLGASGSEILKRMFGVSDEEDELNRKGLPDYQKDANIWYFEWDGEEIQLDMTFANPMSPITAPSAALLKGILSGDPNKGAWDAFRMFTYEFLQSPILGQAYQEVMDNRDAVTGQTIYNSYDRGLDKVSKSLAYMFDNAFEPRIITVAERILKAGFGDEPAVSKEEKIAELLIRELIPVKNINMDDNRNFYSAMKETRDLLNDSRDKTNKLASNNPLTDGDIVDIAKNFKENDTEIMKLARKWWRTSPLSEKEKSMVIGKLNLNKDIQTAIKTGVFKPRDLKESAVKEMKSSDVKKDRLKKFNEVYNDGPKTIHLDR